MEIRISGELNDIIRYSRDEAMRTGGRSITSDHLFLGLLRHGMNQAAETLVALGIDLNDFKKFIDAHVFNDRAVPYSESDSVTFSRLAQNVLTVTVMEAGRMGMKEALPVHLLLALCKSSENYGQAYLRDKNVDYTRLMTFMRDSGMLDSSDESGHIQPPDGQEDGNAEEKPAVEQFGYDLTKAAGEGKLDPVTGREKEIAQVVEILGRRKKNNPMLIGEPGVGKSAIVEGIASLISSGKISQGLARKRIVSLDIASVVAGTRYRGDFEKRLKSIIAEVSGNPDIILFIDEFHTIVGAGGSQGSLDAANILKPALARGEVQCIGATTMDEFRKIVEKDGALDRRFQKVIVEPTDIAQSLSILQNIKENYERFHNVVYTPEALEASVRLSDRYLTDRALPDKAIDAMDQAGSMVKQRFQAGGRGRHKVSAGDVAEVISKMTGIPVTNVKESESRKLLRMGDRLRRQVVGQDEAIEKVVRAIKRNRVGLGDPRRPVGSFLFLGSTGVGKTRLAKCLAEYLFDSQDNMVRIDMSEYMEKFNVSRLIGAPPGYVGYEDAGQLSDRVRRKPYSVVLLDEIEKAHPDIFNILLQVLDEGRLTDSGGRVVDFRNTIVVMTSNAGGRELDEYGSGVGFSTGGKDVGRNRKAVLDKAVRKLFPPEFLNRIDEVVYFNQLTVDDIEKIVDIEVGELVRRAEAAGYRLKVASPVRGFIAASGYDPAYGARQLKRALTRYVETPVSDFILADRILAVKECGVDSGLRTIRVTLDKDKSDTVVSLADSPEK